MSKEKKFYLDPDKLVRLMEIRRLSQVELSKKTGISRPTVNKYCNGDSNPSVDNVHRIAEALSVQFKDLERGEKGGEDAGKLIEKVETLLKSVYPSTLEKNFPYINLLLQYHSKGQSEILNFLLMRTNELGLAFLSRFVHMLEVYPQMYREFSSVINVYYVQNEEDHCEYECLVKFEPWVYRFFLLEDDNQFITFRIEEEKESREWYSVMIDQLYCYYMDEVINLMDNDLGNAFVEFLDCGDWKWPEELVFEDYDPLKKVKTIRLQKLFELLRADGKGYDVLAEVALDKEFAETLFEEYGMKDK